MALLTLDGSNDGGESTARVGDEIRLALPENPSTGYRWQVSMEGDGLEQVDSSYKPDGTPHVGGGGTRTLILRANGVGVTRIDARLVRSWEQNEAPRRFGHLVRIA